MTRFWWDCRWVLLWEERRIRRIRRVGGGGRDDWFGWGSRAVNMF